MQANSSSEINKVVRVVKIINAEQVYNGAGTEEVLEVARSIKALDPDVGVVISRGTNVIPEWAFLLDLTLDRPGPVVITGSMRPISGVSGALALSSCSEVSWKLFFLWNPQLSSDAHCKRLIMLKTGRSVFRACC